MEKRFIVAIVLSFLVLFGWQALFVKKDDQRPVVVEQASEPSTQVVEKVPEKKTPPPIEPEKREEDIQPVTGEREEEVIIDTSLYRAIWSNKGAVLKSWRLKEHKDSVGDDLELINNQAVDLKAYPMRISTEEPEFDSILNSTLYDISKVENKSDGTIELRFTYADAEGNKAEKIFLFRDGFYDFDVQVNVLRKYQPLVPKVVWGPSFGNLTQAEQKGRLGARTGAAFFPPAKVQRRPENNFKHERGNAFNFVQWAAYENNYFVAIFVLDYLKSSAAFIQGGTPEQPVYSLSVNHLQKIWLGPKNYELLDQWGHQAKKVISFGMFGFISEILYRAIKIINRVIPNWGLCIILLTFFIKIILFPLTYSSTKSMAKMQDIQPKVKALRSKYKKAKQDIGQRRKMNEEMMKLYKEHGINPAGGCLPLLLQIPVFWGFWRLLVASVEFRQSPFIFWIKDLSISDPIYITPILMGLTQYISQKMTPTSGDPTQQKMMLIMPVMMTFLFMSFPSGLILYWLTNNVLQIGQQYIINRMKQKKKSEQHGKRRRK